MTTSQIPNIHSKAGRFATRIRYSMLALVMLGLGPLALAQDAHSHMAPPMNDMTREQQNKANALVKIVRDSTERFKESRRQRRRDMSFNSAA